MVGILIDNQMNPDYSSALAVPIMNGLSIILAGIGVVISVMTHQKHPEMVWAKRTKVLGIIFVIVLVILFPLSNLGMLSSVS